MATVRNINEQVVEILKRGRTEGNVFYLPDEKFPRKVYQQINLVLEDAGGEWDRDVGGHVFRENVEEKISAAIENGACLKEKQVFQEFFTPEDLCNDMAWQAQVYGKTVLEPSAGAGNIALACQTFNASSVTCVEIQDYHVQTLKDKGFAVQKKDFLKCKPDELGQFDRVVMNPPFSKGQAEKHIKHALKFLKPDGVLVSIAPNDIRSINGYHKRVVEIEAGRFRESGTNVPTVMIVLWADTGKPHPDHEYLVQKQDGYSGFEVLDLDEQGQVVFTSSDYQDCNDWIEGKV